MCAWCRPSQGLERVVRVACGACRQRRARPGRGHATPCAACLGSGHVTGRNLGVMVLVPHCILYIKK
jgi:hypothetical protein